MEIYEKNRKMISANQYNENVEYLKKQYALSVTEYAIYSENIYNQQIVLIEKNKALEDEIRFLRLSTSWRLGAPLRSIINLIKNRVPWVASLGAYRQRVGIKAILKRLLNFAFRWASPKPTSRVPDASQLRRAPLEPPRTLVAWGHLQGSLLRRSLEHRAFPRLIDTVFGENQKRNILYISDDLESNSHAYRVIRYVHAAQDLGHNAHWILDNSLSYNMDDFDKYDLVVISCASRNERLASVAAYMKALGRLIIFDLGDPASGIEQTKIRIADMDEITTMANHTLDTHHYDFWRSIMTVDAGFAATERLAFQIRQSGKPCYVLPDGFDQDMHYMSRRAAIHWRRSKTDDLVRIGYFGQTQNDLIHLDHCMHSVARILDEYPQCVLTLFKTDGSDFQNSDIEVHPSLMGLHRRIEWRQVPPVETRPFEFARLDINLVPLEVGDPLCESKSERPFFEAALVGTPTVASPTGPFRTVIDHGKSGFLALGEEDWYSYIKVLVQDPKIRARMGKEAYHGALAKFGPIQRREKFARVLASLIGGRDGAQAFALETKLANSRDCRPKVGDSEIIFDQCGDGSARVSVVIPLYNYENYIVEALNSIKSQSLIDIDLIIVDGCSTDKSLSAALAWVQINKNRFNKCIVLKNKANYGLAVCRNTGINETDTPYFIPVDADNRIRPRCCEALLETIEEAKAAFAYSSLQQFGDAESVIGAMPYDPQRLVLDNYIDAMALISKEAWAMIGGYEHIEGGWEDYDFWVRMAENGLFGVWRSDILADYRVHARSMTQTQTLVPENRQRMNDIFKVRHSWVSLGPEQAELNLPRPPRLSHLSPSVEARFRKLLPVLRCPRTRQKLIYDVDHANLISVDGTTRWEVRQGRPILKTGADMELDTQGYMRNDLPDHIVAIVQKTAGLVLSLGAMGNRTSVGDMIQADDKVFRHTDLVVEAPNLPFTDEAFDMIVVTNIFEYDPDPKVVASELRRVLKPGGKLLVPAFFPQPGQDASSGYHNAMRPGPEVWFADFKIEMLNGPDGSDRVYSLFLSP